MIDRSFIEKIEEMASPEVVEASEGTFSKTPLYRLNAPVAENLSVCTLSGFATMVSNEKNYYSLPMYVRVTSPTEVDAFGTLRDDTQRENPFRAVANIPIFNFGYWYSIEELIIALKSKFMPTEDRERLIQLLGNITDSENVTTTDDGITQNVNVSAGIQLVGATDVKPIVKLKPYRTFIEVEQPESDFLIRIRKGSAALFEADGGKWKLDAMHSIGEYLREIFKSEGDIIVVE